MDYEAKRPLMEAIDKCLLDHAAAAGTKEGGPEILDVYLLQGLSEIHYYLKVEHDFKPDEVDALLQFSDPLVVARECWEERDPEKGFPICDILHEIKAYERFELVDPAGYIQQSAERLQSLKDRMDQNMSDFQAELLGMDKAEIIAKSAKITAMQEAYTFMKEDFDFTPAEVSTLLGMENPLKFVADQWPSDLGWLLDMASQIREAIVDVGKEAAVQREAEPATPEQRQAISSEVQATLQMLVDTDLKLYGEVTGDTLEAIQTQGFLLQDGALRKAEPAQFGEVQNEREPAATSDSVKPSLRGQLHEKMREAGQCPPPAKQARGGEGR